MSRIDEHSQSSNRVYYLHHHSVQKLDSLTTKTRCVFDGSCKTSSGLALNDVQMVGPTIQNDLFSIILNFRKHFFVLTADIAKMYRQVLLDERDRDLHRIFWRDSPDEELGCYRLNTVTYGTASAAFLSIRCLMQLSIENAKNYPRASQIIANDFYVDDLLTGSESVEEARIIQHDLSLILATGGFHLRKWLSNEPKIIDRVQIHESEYEVLSISESYETKTLGILWNSKYDRFQYSTKNFKGQARATKRSILFNTSQIFDPLGLLSPITVVAKLIIQSLWQCKLSWDESIPLSLNTRWLEFQDQLQDINEVAIPRHVLLPHSVSVELHGFADASERAFGACVYVKCMNNQGETSVHLLCARSKVAPLKKVTLPRLELCAAVLLVNLCEKVTTSTNIQFENSYYWSDSTVALGWIRAEPQKWKTFVANRVAEIQSLSNPKDWHHIRTSNNPADLVSRGTSPKVLIKSKLWWHGPSWLKNDKCEWPTEVQLSHQPLELPEMRLIILSSNFTQINNFDLFTRYSTLTKLVRVFAYILRFIYFTKSKFSGPLKASELNNSVLKLIKIAQYQQFKREILLLSNGKILDPKSNILSLNPFLDEQGCLRVGGRLTHSKLVYNKKHPMVLPAHHALTKLIARNEHVKLLHCGPQHLLASLRENYWPLAARNLVRKTVHECITCFRNKPKLFTPLMGALPIERIEPSYPFCNTGVDYAGPFFIRDRKTRGFKLTKCYIALFICLVTKAIHLELVSDLTSDNFLACLRRFIARRGKPQKLMSDNGTNFRGAHSKLLDLANFLSNKSNENSISDALSAENISWSFIPPRSPHFAGLWEAGVKSTKIHLTRVIGNAHLTFEEFGTVLTQIECVLNSRPLSPLSSDPNDFKPLTPAHFLIGRKLTTAPDPDVTHLPENRLSIFQRQQSILQHFWKRWSREYIGELQNRTKWKSNSMNLIKIGSLVLIQEDNNPPNRWKLGRIIELHPGQDEIVRVVTIQCANGTFKRAVAKICVLPVETA